MPLIEGFRIRNFRSLRDVQLGRLWNDQNKQPLTPMTVVVGQNGVGKSSLFDALGFLADCLKHGVEEACDLQQRGGFDRLRSRGSTGPIEFEVYYREEQKSRPITYELSMDVGADDQRPYVARERLRQRRKGQPTGRPYSFLRLEGGRGMAWKGEYEGQLQEKMKIDELIQSAKNESADSEEVQLDNPRMLGVATLGAMKQHPRIAAFRRFIEGWYLSYFTPDAARSLPMAGPQKHLNMHGDNLGNVVQFMEREHKDRFQNILDRIAKRIPGVQKIHTEKSADGRLLLCFNDRGFKDPFYAQQMSDGTLKVFAYLLMLEDPEPPPFICIEEPENGLYHKLLSALASEFRAHANGRRRGSQIFVTTHQPYFVDALQPEEVWILEKRPDGFATVRRASDDPVVVEMVNQEIPLGGLWYSDYLDTH